MRVIKKPIEMKAEQFDGTPGSADLIAKNINLHFRHWWYSRDGMVLNTLKGKRVARAGDWVIKEKNGDFYTINDITFKNTFVGVE